MAVDSAEKRFSMIGFGVPWIHVTPTGTVDAAVRATFLNLYGGIALGLPAVPADTNKLTRDLTGDLVVNLVVA